MANGIDEIKDMQTILSMPLPEPSEIKKDSINSAVWLAAIERLESRLIFANELHNKAWQNGPRSIIRKPVANINEMTLKDIQQSILILESHLVAHSSKPFRKVEHFPFNEILKKLLRFKARLAFDPSFRMLFDYAANAIESHRKTTFPSVSILPTSKLNNWYRYYANYKVILNIVDFEGELIKSISFDNEWVKNDEGLIISLCAYCIFIEQKKGMTKILNMATSLLEKQPSFKHFYNAANALT